ncbi:MAG: class B sortase [Eubacteriaceae bacterium]|nr:class B sortase [Eubacteriaceae bacterium]
MAENLNQMPNQRKTRVYRVKSAPFENPFRADMLAAAEAVPTAEVSKRKRREKSKAKKAKRPMRVYEAVVYSMCIVAFSFGLFGIAMEVIPRYKQIQEIRDIRLIAVTSEAGSSNSIQNGSRKELPDFTVLKEINADVVGWLSLDIVEVFDPVVQGKDNDYYLNHSFKGNYNSAGALYMDAKANGMFTDQNTVIYGHNMKDGTMFAKLKRYLDQETYDAQPIITVYTPGGKVFYYHIFAVVVLDPYDKYREPNYNSNFANFISRISRLSAIKSSASASASDRLLCLSTCHGRDSEERLAVFAVLLNPDGADIDITGIKP